MKTFIAISSILISMNSFAMPLPQKCEINGLQVNDELSMFPKDAIPREFDIYEEKAKELLEAKGYEINILSDELIMNYDYPKLVISFAIDYNFDFPQIQLQSTDSVLKKLAFKYRNFKAGYNNLNAEPFTKISLKSQIEKPYDIFNRYYKTMAVYEGKKVQINKDLEAIELIINQLPDCTR